ncbi:hypothetical protein BGP84_11805 [Pseudomonas putida]|jgi:hypothetical protein|uniref:Uncharacterized protein n=1 Tax=Pseudomonas putida TaxID=303 RepID=A0A2S3X4H0_PSEPU|nr:hypothetical protein [Pseudomonas putida]POG10375.1 hypothetical protein BGP84_11805 [Pseudomonas putida]POG16517.1 hypothetical protein BGP85_10295 [Pseudomonas putida]
MSTKDNVKKPLLTLYSDGEGSNGYPIDLDKTTLNEKLPALQPPLAYTHYKIENAKSANLITFSNSLESQVNGNELLIFAPIQSTGHATGTFQIRVIVQNTTTAICPLSDIYHVKADEEVITRGIRVMKCERAATDDANQPRMVSVVY